jgi:hypothetical protein
MLMQAQYNGLAFAGGDASTWQELWESTLSEAELQAQYEENFQELSRRDEERRQADTDR